MPLDPTYMAFNVLRPDQIAAGGLDLQQKQQDVQASVNKNSLFPLERQQVQQQVQQGANTLDTEKLKLASDKLDYSLQSLSRVQNQQQYDAWKQDMNAKGIDTTGDPDVFDPNWKQQSLLEGMSLKDKLTLQAQNPFMNLGVGGGMGINSAIAMPASSPPGNLPANVLFAQESGNNPNSPTSINGAVGQAQIIPATFQRYAQPGEDINNPKDNVAVGQRILADLQQKYPGDAARQAVGYFSGEGNVAPPGSPTPWVKDVADGNGKTVSSYVNDINSKMGGNQSSPGMAASPSSSGKNDQVLAAMPPQIASQVKALAEGRMAFPSGFALKSPYWQGMLSAVSQYDPSFDAVNYNARSKMRNDITSGKIGQNINAINTVIGHLQVLSDAADKLNNRGIPAWNTVANLTESALGDPRVKNFNATKKAVVDELTRVYRASGGSENDIKTWSDAIDSSGSPEQLHSVIAQIGDLLESKLDATKEQIKQGMGTTDIPVQVVSPKASAALDVLRQRSGGQQVSAATSNPLDKYMRP